MIHAWDAIRVGVVVESIGGPMMEDVETQPEHILVMVRWVILVGIAPVGRFQCVSIAIK